MKRSTIIGALIGFNLSVSMIAFMSAVLRRPPTNWWYVLLVVIITTAVGAWEGSESRFNKK